MGEGCCAARAVEEGEGRECHGEEEEGSDDALVSTDVQQRLRLSGEFDGRPDGERFCIGIWLGWLVIRASVSCKAEIQQGGKKPLTERRQDQISMRVVFDCSIYSAESMTAP